MFNNNSKTNFDLLFITAMDEEMSSVVRHAIDEDFQPQLKNDNSKESYQEVIARKQKIYGNSKFFTFTLESKNKEGEKTLLNCLGCITGIGKVNAALGLERACQIGNFSKVVNIGLVGAINATKTPKGTVILANTASYGDVDVRGFGYQFGQVPGMKEAIFTLSGNIEDLYQASLAQGFPVHKGRLLTTDSFIDNKALKEQIIANVTESEEASLAKNKNYQSDELLALDMEGAALAQTANQHNLSLYMVKQVSDTAEEDANVEFSMSAYGSESKELRNINLEDINIDSCGYAVALVFHNLNIITA